MSFTTKLYATEVDPIFSLMDDNAPCLTTAIVHDFLESEVITRFEWLAFSPDSRRIIHLKILGMPSAESHLDVYHLHPLLDV